MTLLCMFTEWIVLSNFKCNTETLSMGLTITEQLGIAKGVVLYRDWSEVEY